MDNYDKFTLKELNLMYTCAGPSPKRDEIGAEIDKRVSGAAKLHKALSVMDDYLEKGCSKMKKSEEAEQDSEMDEESLKKALEKSSKSWRKALADGKLDKAKMHQEEAKSLRMKLEKCKKM